MGVCTLAAKLFFTQVLPTTTSVFHGVGTIEAFVHRLKVLLFSVAKLFHVT